VAAAAGGGFELGTEGKLEGVKDPQANGTEERRGLLKKKKGTRSCARILLDLTSLTAMNFKKPCFNY